MANKFTVGMRNLVEVLNQMWDAFVVGPYNALSLAGGRLTGPLTTTSTIGAAGDIRSDGVIAARVLKAGPETPVVGWSVIRMDGPERTACLSLANICDFYNISGAFGNDAPAAIIVGRNSVTGRSINAGGTINANGADYAEYMVKGALCGTILPGQIVGIDAAGRLTDKWDLATSFAAKSTDPCMVGGDGWATHLGQRPVMPAREEAEADAHWELRMANALAAQQGFDVALEQARQTVDRIAFAGQVPVNLLGAAPGQFIVPVQDGEGIAGQAIDEADMTLAQYMRAIGRVITIEDDGRARIIVKVA